MTLPLIFLKELEKIDEKLSKLYLESNNLYNHKIGVYKIFRRLVNNFRFIYESADISSQQITTSLCRMITDHYAIFYLLSCNSTRSEQYLRYCLYLADSLNSRINTIRDFSGNIKNVSEEILKNNTISNSHDENVIKKLLLLIDENNLDKIVDKEIINRFNWKFGTSSVPAQNKKYYNWKELYTIARIPQHFSTSIQNHFSSFTHGLGMTILYYEDNTKNTYYVYEFLKIIQSLVGKIMILNYREELEDIQFRNDFVEMGDEGWISWNKY